jgi:hypothetical protein
MRKSFLAVHWVYLAGFGGSLREKFGDRRKGISLV